MYLSELYTPFTYEVDSRFSRFSIIYLPDSYQNYIFTIPVCTLTVVFVASGEGNKAKINLMARWLVLRIFVMARLFTQ